MDDSSFCYVVRIGAGPSAVYSQRLLALRAAWRAARAGATSLVELESCLRLLFPEAAPAETLDDLARRLLDRPGFRLELTETRVVFETVRVDAEPGESTPVTALPPILSASSASWSPLSLAAPGPPGPVRGAPADSAPSPVPEPLEEGLASSFAEPEPVEPEPDFLGYDEEEPPGEYMLGPDEVSLVGTRLNPEALLADLNEQQRAAVRAGTGPVCILAGAGTGKTRVISRRIAYACATGVTTPEQVLVVSFTEKAAREMGERLAALGLRGVRAATFHGAALSQVRLFWERFRQTPFPEIVASKVGLLIAPARSLPGGYRYIPVADLAAEIEWAKVRRLTPQTYRTGAQAVGHHGPLPPDLFRRVFAGYERAKGEAIDFEDMLGLALRFIEEEPEARALVRSRYRWFSVDEYQDTNPLQQALLEAWLDGREELCVVGDENQTIYSFTGASSEYLTGFGARYPGATLFTLEDNYRSTQQVLDPANRLLAHAGREPHLRATRPAGPAPRLVPFATAAAELAGTVAEVRRLLGLGVAGPQIALLLRTNAQIPPFEEALRAAGLSFQVRGERFFERFEIRRAVTALRRAGSPGPGGLVAQVSAAWTRAFAFDPAAVGPNEEARERTAALLSLLAIARSLEEADPGASIADFLAEIARRAAAEHAVTSGAIELLTYHRAKGLEWDAVLLPSLEEGLLPHRASTGVAATAEERRLFYVGMTRARKHLWLAWARARETSTGKLGVRKPSRFLREAFPESSTQAISPSPRPAATRGAHPRGTPGQPVSAATGSDRAPAQPADRFLDEAGAARLERLRAWRSERARRDGVPAYIVVQNAALAEIAATRPVDLGALARVKGIGPAKLERYGAEILARLKT
jgi:DNA helicase-2/ATP-dependent DNA helicase PcrA